MGSLWILDLLIVLEWHLRLSQQKVELLHFDGIMHGFVLKDLINHAECFIVRHSIAIEIVKATA